MTADEGAALLGVDRNTVYDFASRGVIPHQRLGKRLLFRRGAVVAWLDNGPLATHPARLLAASLFERAATADAMRPLLAELSRDLTTIGKCDALVRDSDALLPLSDVVERHRFARRVRSLVNVGLTGLLDPGSDLSRRFRTVVASVTEEEKALDAATTAARGWRDPLAADDASRALVLANRFESGFFARVVRWFSPGWWKLRRLLLSRFDVTSRSVLGDWSEFVGALVAQQLAQSELGEARAKLAEEVRGADPVEARAIVDEMQRPDAITPALRSLRELLAQGGTSARAVTDMASDAAAIEAHLSLLRGWEHLDLDTLKRELSALDRDVIALTPLRGPLGELERANGEVSALLRRYPLDGRSLEALVARRAIATSLRERAPDLAIAEGSIDALGEEMERAATDLRDANAQALVETVRGRFVERAQLATAPAAGLTSAQKETKRAYSSGRRELEHELGKVMRHKTIREIVSGPAGAVVRDIKPVWLMSPLSVADVLPLESFFDLVIFDEASQIPLEDAVPAIHRASQVIVVGDRQQLPPTNFFATSIEEEDEGADESLDGLDSELDADSLLTHADRTLPSTLLGWHYRSRHESLIDFSNRAFYGGRLLTVPPVIEPQKREPIVAHVPEDGRAGCDRMLERAISFHRVDGVYEWVHIQLGQSRRIPNGPHVLAT